MYSKEKRAVIARTLVPGVLNGLAGAATSSKGERLKNFAIWGGAGGLAGAASHPRVLSKVRALRKVSNLNPSQLASSSPKQALIDKVGITMKNHQAVLVKQALASFSDELEKLAFYGTALAGGGLIGGAMGSVAGAIAAKPGERGKGALRGALGGGAVGAGIGAASMMPVMKALRAGGLPMSAKELSKAPIERAVRAQEILDSTMTPLGGLGSLGIFGGGAAGGATTWLGKSKDGEDRR